MEETTKRKIGISIGIFFGLAILSNFIALTVDGLGSLEVYNYYTILYAVAGIAIYLYLAFNKKISSNALVKNTACILVLSFCLDIANTISILSSPTPLIDLGKAGYIIYSLAGFALSLLFYWGLKIWKAIKIAITVRIIPIALSSIAWLKFSNALESSDYGYIDEAINSYQSTTDLTNILFFVINVAALALTIIWLTNRHGQKIPKQGTISTAPTPGTANNLINKIPHK